MFDFLSRRIVSTLVVGTAFLFLSGCHSYKLLVNSISAEKIPAEKTYILLSGMNGVSNEDLQFQQFAKYLKKALSISGYNKISRRNNVNFVILVNYGVSEPHSFTETTSSPVYGKVGGGSTYYTNYNFGSRGITNNSGILYTPNRYGVVSNNITTKIKTIYASHLMLTAIDALKYRTDGTIVKLWETTVTTTDKKGDIRQIFPFLVAGSIPYIGHDTGKEINTRISDNNDLLKAITED